MEGIETQFEEILVTEAEGAGEQVIRKWWQRASPFLSNSFRTAWEAARAQWPACGVIGKRPRSLDIGLCLFLADRPFRLGHLEISFGICSNHRRRWFLKSVRTHCGFVLMKGLGLGPYNNTLHAALTKKANDLVPVQNKGMYLILPRRQVGGD